MSVRYSRVAVKVGSNVITRSDKLLDVARIALLVEQIAKIRLQGVEVVLITSGAVAAGRSELTASKKLDDVSLRQLWSAIGQARLINRYYDLFKENRLLCAQVLCTKEDFKDRQHYLNMKRCLATMLENGVVPVINENDTISITELMFTDNDELSGLVASMLGCDALIILTNVDGVYTGNPADSSSKLITEVYESTKLMVDAVSTGRSEFGRGGMVTKASIATKLAKEGINVHIANGKREGILEGITLGDDLPPNTHFKAAAQPSSTIKKWLAHSEAFAKGSVTINSGAAEALKSDCVASLLLVGVEAVSGYFICGDLVSIADKEGRVIGVGRAQYDSVKALALAGTKQRKPFIHYDYLYLVEEYLQEAEG